MDYSLLLGIYYETPENKEKTAQNVAKLAESTTVINTWYQNDFQKFHNVTQVTRPDGVTEIYYFGMIDILIQYKSKKKMEHFMKAVVHGYEEVSVVHPDFYANRFFKFMEQLVEHDHAEGEGDGDQEPNNAADSSVESAENGVEEQTATSTTTATTTTSATLLENASATVNVSKNKKKEQNTKVPANNTAGSSTEPAELSLNSNITDSSNHDVDKGD